MEIPRMLIDGALVDGTSSLDVIDPSTGASFATVGRASLADLNAAVAAAKAAQPAWGGLPHAERRAALLRFADEIGRCADDLARLLVQEQGKPLHEARNEIRSAEATVRDVADLELTPRIVRDDGVYRIEVHYKPLGVVAGITPWNFPVLIGVSKMAPALLAGNTFILKPPPTTPLTSLRLGELARPIFPRGVFNVIVDANDLGSALTDHPDVAKVSFTGSTATGRKVMASGAATVKRVALELGGNDAGVVFDDVDVKEAAAGVFAGAFHNCGQVCTAIKRVYAHEAIYDEFCRELARLATETVVGNGLEQGTTIGPLQNRMQFEKALRYLRIAASEGTIIAGGEAHGGPGYFVNPTIVRDIGDDSDLVTEEQFAPILPVLRFSDVDDVVARVNDTPYGLGGSVWAKDHAQARRVAARMASGIVWINQHLHFDPAAPFGGAKQSGVGLEGGLEGLAAFTQMSVIDQLNG